MKFKNCSGAWIAAGILTAGLGLAEVPAGERGRAYASPGKPNAPIEMNYSVRDEPVAGVPLTVEVSVSSRVRADSLIVEFNFPNGAITPVSDLDLQPIGGLAAGEQYTRSIRILPREQGQLYVNVVATLLRDGVPQSRAFSIPIRVGNAIPFAAEARGTLETDDAGRALVSLPAPETGTGL